MNFSPLQRQAKALQRRLANPAPPQVRASGGSAKRKGKGGEEGKGGGHCRALQEKWKDFTESFPQKGRANGLRTESDGDRAAAGGDG